MLTANRRRADLVLARLHDQGLRQITKRSDALGLAVLPRVDVDDSELRARNAADVPRVGLPPGADRRFVRRRVVEAVL
jgi:hypothetical protein